MSKTIIVGDPHFGARANSEVFLESLENAFTDFIFPLARKEGITEMKIMGDVLDNRNMLNLKISTRMIEVFRKATDFDITIIVGNHDLYYKNRKTVIGFEFLADMFPNIEIISKVTEREEYGKKILYIPWLCLKEEYDTVEKLLEENTYDICYGHLSINTFHMVKNFVEKKGLAPSLFAKCKRVFSGHFHIRSERDNIIYVGTPYSITWADEGNTKGVYIYNSDTDQRIFHENPVSPIFKKLYTSNLYDKKDFSDLRIPGNFIKIIVDNSMPDLEVNNLYTKLESMGPLNIEIENVTEDFLSGAGNSYSLSDLKNTFEFLSEYVDKVNLPDDINREDLMSYLKGIHQKSER